MKTSHLIIQTLGIAAQLSAQKKQRRKWIMGRGEKKPYRQESEQLFAWKKTPQKNKKKK